MSNSITYYNRYNVKDIYDIFNKNRVNKISLGTTNAYISYAVGTDYAYIYADVSSEKLNDAYIGCAYFKVNGTSYNFYRNYSYTYTESVNGNILLDINKLHPILIAYDFVNKTDDDNKFEFNHVNIAHNSGTGTVNVFSDISYNIEKENIALNNYYNEYKTYTVDIKELLNGETYGDFTTYVNYSYIKSETPRTGVVHTDGKQRLFDNEFNDIHVWSLSNGVDMTPHAYVDNDTGAVNAYTYLNCGNTLNTFFRNNISNIFDYTSNNYKYIKFHYDINSSVVNGLQQQWKAGIVGTDKIYAKDLSTDSNNLNYYKFYQVCKVELDNVNSFDEIYNKPSLRKNSDTINCYINIKGESNPSYNQESLYINPSNENKARFVKKISKLPQHLLCKDFKLKIEIQHGEIDENVVIYGDGIYINKISVGYVTDNDGGVPNNDEYNIIEDKEGLQFNLGSKIVDGKNILYVTSIANYIDENNLYVKPEYIKYIDNNNYGTSYVELGFNTSNIYQEYENTYNTIINRIDIYGNDNINNYLRDPLKITYSFGDNVNINNTFYTGDFHIIVKQKDGVNQTVNESSSITFSLPNSQHI